MTKRRARGEGTTYRRKDGRWIGQYTVDTLDGTRRRAVYATSTKEVRAKLAEAISNRDKGLNFDAGNLSVADYLDRWLEGIEDSIGANRVMRQLVLTRIVRLRYGPESEVT